MTSYSGTLESVSCTAVLSAVVTAPAFSVFTIRAVEGGASSPKGTYTTGPTPLPSTAAGRKGACRSRPRGECVRVEPLLQLLVEPRPSLIAAVPVRRELNPRGYVAVRGGQDISLRVRNKGSHAHDDAGHEGKRHREF